MIEWTDEDLQALRPGPDWVLATCPDWCRLVHRLCDEPIGVHERTFDDEGAPHRGVSVAVEIDASGKVTALAGIHCDTETVEFADEPAIIANLWSQAAEFLRELGLN
jgi:hypothetical protein